MEDFSKILKMDDAIRYEDAGCAMRRLMFVFLVSSLLVNLTFIEKVNIPYAKASSPVHQGNLILNGNNVTTIENTRFDINGSILVEENATLILKNAVVNFTQPTHWQYNMSFRNPSNGNPRLQATNTTIVSASDFAFNVAFFQNSSGSLLNCTIPWRGELKTYDISTVFMTNSTIRDVEANNNSTMVIHNSTFVGVYLYHYCKVYATNATVGSFVDYSHGCYLSVWNSTISSLDGRRSNTYVHNSSIDTVWLSSESINCSIVDFTVENVTFWNSLVDFSIAISTTGHAANVTIESTRVHRWRCTFYGQSNVTVTNSTLVCLDASGSSTMSVSNSTIDDIYSFDLSSVSISNSTIRWANPSDYSTMTIFNTTCSIWTEDFPIVKLINADCIVYRGLYSNASIYYCWYLNVHVVDSLGSDVPNAEVTAQYSNGTIAQKGTTNINGEVRLILAEKVWNDTGKCYFGNYTVEAGYWSYSDTTTVNMTGNKKITLTLGGFVMPTAILIKADGSVDPPEAPIQRDGNLYTLTDDIYLPIVVERDNIVVDGAGYALQGTGSEDGIYLSDRNNVTIKNMEIKAFDYIGIHLDNSSKNIISGNKITNNLYGIRLENLSNANIISGNNITANEWIGIWLVNSSDNTVSGNTITNNDYGIYLEESSNNLVYHNNFVNNTQQVYMATSGYANFWNNSVEGNYWSNYTGLDLDHDGIGDSEHQIDADNVDYKPLMGRFHSFNTSLELRVNVISNSTIDKFQYFESNSTIKMYVSNMTATQTYGFCRICIPKALMSVSNLLVIIDDGLTPVLYHDYTLYDNGTHRWIYFAYPHSTREIDIIPELPSLIILSLLMIAALLTAIVYRRKLRIT